MLKLIKNFDSIFIQLNFDRTFSHKIKLGIPKANIPIKFKN
jgi:hypothetical protein